MSFAAPLVMGIVPILLALVWWMFRPTRAAVLASFANIRRLWADHHGLSDSATARRRRTHGVLLGLGAILALCALSRPQWGKVEETTYDQSREVLLALDLSRSMLAGDVSPTRLDRAKLLIESLLDQLRGERVGLVVFAGTSFLQSPMSADYEVLRDFLRELDPSYLPQGGTDYGSMLQTSLKAFGEEGDGDRFLVVLSDGEAHDEQWRSLLPALQQKGIHVIGLGVATAEGSLLPDVKGGVMKDENGAAVLSRLEPETLQELASATGGAYRDAATWVDIAEVVHQTVDQGRAGHYVEQKDVRLRDQFQWFLAPALLFFLLSYWLELPVLPVPRMLRQRQKITAPVRAAAMSAALLLALGLPRFSAAAAPAVAMEPGAMPVLGGPGTARPTTFEPGEPGMAGAVPAPGGPGTAGPTTSLEGVVEELADKPALNPPDYERLASTTIDVASKPGSLHGPARLGVIDDALRGVGEGEQLDAKAADWPKLRDELERLKQEQEQKQQQQKQDQQQQQKDAQGGDSQQNQQNQQDQQKGGQGEQKDSGEKTQDGASSAPSSGAGEAAPSKQEQQDDAKSADSPQQGQDGEQDEQQNAGQGDPRQQNEQKNSADAKSAEPKPLQDASAGLGQPDTNEQKEEKPSPAQARAEQQAQGEQKEPKPGARMVGGGPVQQQPTDGQSVAMVEALDRMERIKDGDSPSTLFDRMNRAEGVQPQKKNGKNW